MVYQCSTKSKQMCVIIFLIPRICGVVSGRDDGSGRVIVALAGAGLNEIRPGGRMKSGGAG